MPSNASSKLTDPLGNLQPDGFPGLPEGWSSEWRSLTSSDQRYQLFVVEHRKKEPKGKEHLFVLHGLGEHGGRYLHFPHYLQSSVESVTCLDMRGHGRSEGVRGHVDRFEQFSDDLALAIRDRLSLLEQGERLHLFGHSMGGLVVLRTLFANPDLPLASVTVSSPLLGIAVPVPKVKKAAGRLLSNFWGSLQMANEINPEWVSHDPAVAKAYRDDRLVHDKVTPRYYTELVRTLDEVHRQREGIIPPLLMTVAEDDLLVDPKRSVDFFNRLKKDNKRLKLLAGFYHEAFNDVHREEAFDELTAWIAENSA